MRANNGTQFCVPSGAQFQDYTDVLSRYQQAHPELEGVIGGQSALAAFKAAYPCAADKPEASATPALPAPAPAPAPAPQAMPQDDRSPIDISPSTQVLEKLASTTGHENDALIAEIQNNAGNYQPSVLVALTLVLYRQGKTDEAIFWLSAARLRANYDAARCADASARPAARAIMSVVPRELLRAQFADLPKLRKIVSEVVRWDESTPYNYDQRWINLQGSGANAGTSASAPMSLPREEWPALAAKTRADYVTSLDAAIKQIGARE